MRAVKMAEKKNHETHPWKVVAWGRGIGGRAYLLGCAMFKTQQEAEEWADGSGVVLPSRRGDTEFA